MGGCRTPLDCRSSLHPQLPSFFSLNFMGSLNGLGWWGPNTPSSLALNACRAGHSWPFCATCSSVLPLTQWRIFFLISSLKPTLLQFTFSDHPLLYIKHRTLWCMHSTCKNPKVHCKSHAPQQGSLLSRCNRAAISDNTHLWNLTLT